MATKLCKNCGIEKDVSMFSKRSMSKDKLQIQCRVCLNAKNKENAEKRGLEGYSIKRTSKRCNLCGDTKPIGQFHIKRKYSADGYGSYCKPCWSVYVKDKKNARKSGNQ